MEKFVDVKSAESLSNVFGSMNCNIESLEKNLGVSVEQRAGGLSILGDNQEAVDTAAMLLLKLMDLDSSGNPINRQIVNYLSEQMKDGETAIVTEFAPDTVCVTAKGKPVKSKTDGQNRYVEAMREHDIVFAVGPAGTGKTYLAVAMAVDAFRRHLVDRIILTRPAVEAGEKLGFLPGDLQMKVDPYMRPLYDSLHEMMGADAYLKNMEKGLIEVSPLAYMRGRTLDHAFIILDEAQNTTPEQMKMFLTRMGFDSKVVVTGDITQIDLPPGQKSGLKEVRKILRAMSELAFIDLDAKDVVRNDLVQQIIRAYDNYERQRRDRR
ncbi:MAG: PhoH family protein [Fastidiosipilaceae bacterium]